MTRRTLLAAATIAATFGASACSLLSAEPDPTRFAVLASVDELPGAERADPAAKGPSLGLGPIVVPEYLLRPEVQTRTEGTRLVPSKTEVWGEPLDRGLERVLAIDLAHALGAQRVAIHPWYASDRPDVQVRITFSRFERTGPEEVVLAAAWSIGKADAEVAPVEHGTRLVRATKAGDGASAALALSVALADLTREIAEAWRSAGGAAR